MESLKICQELKDGGDWLGAARSWMQSNIKEGDTLPWSSGKSVSIPFCKLEEFALRISIAAVAEDRRRNKTAGVTTVFVVDHIGSSYGEGMDKTTVIVGNSLNNLALVRGTKLLVETKD